ncbi:MAG: glycosyltransferase family 2 protein [Bauldia sp.]|nr:glycosyltransferase family 2 protein [Bauldia sp.]
MARQEISVVVPVFNEEAGLDALVERLGTVFAGIDIDWNVLFVDDGSTDGTLDRLRSLNAEDRRFRTISFSRNFGKEIALAAGLRYATGDAVVLMDADLQHPPALIASFIDRWQSGATIVYGQRMTRRYDGLLRRGYSAIFHATFNKIAGTRLPEGIVDFLLLDRKAVAAFNRLDERTRFSKGLYAWIGFSTAIVPFDYGERQAGRSRWSFFRLAQFALDGFVSFSSLPLKVWSYAGALISLAAIAYGIFILVRTLLFNTDLPGFPSLIVSIMFFSGIQLVSLGIMGEYLARIYEEVKARPLFVVAEEIGVDGETLRGSDT